MKNVKVTYEGTDYSGILVHQFKCELTSEMVGVVRCYDDGAERAFPLNLIRDENSDWLTLEEVEADRGFYSDRYKEVIGVRPRNLTNKQLTDWMNKYFTVIDRGDVLEIIKRNR